jgi:hypothetical protein
VSARNPSDLSILMIAAIFAANIRRYVSGEPLANIINAARGY